MKKWLDAIFCAYSGIFLLRRPMIGALVAGVTLLNPRVTLSGLAAAAAAYLFARLIHMEKAFAALGHYIYNPLLTGMAIGHLFQPSPQTFLLLVTAGILAFLCTIVTANIFYVYLKLPVLSLPFVIIVTIVYLASARYVNLTPNEFNALDSLHRYLPLWLSGYFKSLGAIFFMPQAAVGAVFALFILAGSRILFLLSLMGYFTGTVFTALMVGSFSRAFADINHFNAILAAMAVGGLFLIPSLKSYLLAVTAAGVSTLFLHAVVSFWWYASIPGFTLAFNAAALGFLYVLGAVNCPLLVWAAKPTPEENLDWYLLNRDRCSRWDAAIMPPFPGKWTVWQGFGGQWTHRDNWKYAYDFIITDEAGSSFRGSGSRLQDYYAYGKPVLSPVRGKVVKTIGHLPDNAVGKPDEVNNWGNLVIIKDERGFFVELSHFSPGSIRVNEGEDIQPGALLGLCGNSGYSSQPHIHIQVQATSGIGAYTIPFTFVNYTLDNNYYAHGAPAEGAHVESLYRQPAAGGFVQPAAGDVHRYHVVKKGNVIDRLRLEVKMAVDGTLYFDSGRGKLYFGTSGGAFYFYSLEGKDPYLKIMLTALPQLPLGCHRYLQWQENIPVSLLSRGWSKAGLQLLTSFWHDLPGARANFTCSGINTVTGRIGARFPGVNIRTRVEWNETAGFTLFRAGDLELRK
jgi:urea transporter/murein DD-endopeptidase MepM/ murein hydrolase activator NlpD